jgi:hypothetical protein
MLFPLAFCSPRERQESRPHITSSYARYSSPQMSTDFDNIMRNERRDNAVTCELALLIVERHPFPPTSSTALGAATRIFASLQNFLSRLRTGTRDLLTTRYQRLNALVRDGPGHVAELFAFMGSALVCGRGFL